MKLTMRSATILSALIFGSVAASHAANVNVPFDFEAVGVAFPAGQYEVNESLNHGFISLQSRQTPAKHILWVTHPGEPSKTGDVVLSFDRTGSTPILMSIQDSFHQTNGFSRTHAKGSMHQQSLGN